MTSIALITVYHFNSSKADSYARLVRGLRSMARQLGPNDKLILVANGIRDGAEDPDKVLKEVDSAHPERIEPVVILNNIHASGGLNVGISAALRQRCHWIGSVQSSVVVGAGWLETMRSKAHSSKADGFAGRLVYEEQPDTIWSEGHYLKCGLTQDIRYNRALNDPGEIGDRWAFPCLSAALFSAKTVQSVVDNYGNFVTERLPHYGDCTDVALRCARLGHKAFSLVEDARGTKRRPHRERAEIMCSQLLAAQRYYSDRFEEVRKSLEDSKYVRFLDDALRCALNLDSGQYSPKNQPPPKASNLEDQEWGASISPN